MQEAMRGPIFRIIFSFGFEVVLVVLMAPILSICLGQPMHIIGGGVLAFGLLIIPVNYLYNLIFDRQLLRLGKPLYNRSFGLRLFHALFFEAIVLPLSVPMIMHILDYSAGQALKLGLIVGAVVPIYTLFVNWAFDAY